MQLFFNGKRFSEAEYGKEADFEREVFLNYKLFFGDRSVLIDAKRKVESKAIGTSVPDGFLFDLSDMDNPEFYILEVELKKHGFFDHIFPQMTKFFAFFRNSKSQSELVEKIFSLVNTDPELKKEFKKHIGEKEIYKFIKDTVEGSQNILLILDGDKAELSEITETYTDTWGKMVKIITIKKYQNEKEIVFTMHPEFESLEYFALDAEPEEESEKVKYSEEYHLEGINQEVKEIYGYLKSELLAIDSSIRLNPQKYYISVVKGKNVAYFKFRRKNIRLIPLLSLAETKKIVPNYVVKELSVAVQKYYNAPCCAVLIDDKRHLDEVMELIKRVIKTHGK